MTATYSSISQVPYCEYALWPGDNASRLKDLAESPRYYKWRQEHSRRPTDDMLLGGGIHTCVLEPDRFPLEYVLWDGKVRRGRAWDEFQAANANRVILRLPEYNLCLASRDAVRNDSVAGPIVRAGGGVEQCISWHEPTTGRLCKSRIDLLQPGECIYELKSTKSLDATQFGRVAARLGYHISMAFYQDALFAATGERLPVRFIVVGNCTDHDVIVADVDDEILACGRSEYQRLLRLLIECEKDDSWPGKAGLWPGELGQPVREMYWPDWASPQEEALVLTHGDEKIVF